jgi:radical SAM superfamily enzyme YgiQ (UPF0313 family)
MEEEMMIEPKRTTPLVIYLVELAHDGFGLSLRTFPLGLGTVGAFAKARFGDQVDIRLFRTHGDLMAAVDAQMPDVVGFGYFSWNDYITLVSARTVRARCPEVLIVFGGANISPYGQQKTSGFPFGGHVASRFPVSQTRKAPTLHSFVWPVYNDEELLVNYADEIDVIVHGDGEIPMADLIGTFLERRDRRAVREASVQGCSAIVGHEIVQGPDAEILFDLDRIPSPYSSGLFKGFMDQYKLLPQIETTRGCPYACTFCTVGLNEGKLRKHSMEYSRDEILYLKEHYPNTVLRIADPNWGMLPKDVELAQWLHDLRRDTGYPSSLRVYYSAGGPFHHIKEMAVLLKDVLPLNMSFQSLNVETLKTIKRGNMPMEKVDDMVVHARANGIATSTELISSLPLEGLASFKESFLRAVTLRLDSVYVGALYLIKGSELYTADDRARYKFRTKFALIEKDVTRIDGQWVFEMDEFVVEHSKMTEEDFFEGHRFKIWGLVGYGSAYLKEIIMHCLSYGVTLLDIYDELVGHPEVYPFHQAMLSGFIAKLRPLFFDTPGEMETALAAHIEAHGTVDQFYWNHHVRATMAKVLGKESKVTFVNEVVDAAERVYACKMEAHASREDREAFYSILSVLRHFQPECIVSPLEQTERVVNVSLPFDIKAWAEDNYEIPLGQYLSAEPREFSLVVRNFLEHRNFLRDTRNFSSDAEKYEYYYNVMVSSNMRRYITYAEEQHSLELTLPGVVNPLDNN